MKKIIIFGSTGSIGTSLLNLIKKDKKNFNIELISANRNYKKLIKQAKFFNVKNIIITDHNSFLITTKLLKDTKIKITRIARGLPMGGEIEFVDSGTLAQAVVERKIL